MSQKKENTQRPTIVNTVDYFELVDSRGTTFNRDLYIKMLPKVTTVKPVSEGY